MRHRMMIKTIRNMVYLNKLFKYWPYLIGAQYLFTLLTQVCIFIDDVLATNVQSNMAPVC